MELRLVNGIVYSESEPWFGRWGYKFWSRMFWCNTIDVPKSHRSNKKHATIPTHTSHRKFQSWNPINFFKVPNTFSSLSYHTWWLILLHVSAQVMASTRETCIGFLQHTSALVETNCRCSPKRIEMATRVIVKTLKRT
jgi:hypothetical protein